MGRLLEFRHRRLALPRIPPTHPLHLQAIPCRPPKPRRPPGTEWLVRGAPTWPWSACASRRCCWRSSPAACRPPPGQLDAAVSGLGGQASRAARTCAASGRELWQSCGVAPRTRSASASGARSASAAAARMVWGGTPAAARLLRGLLLPLPADLHDALPHWRLLPQVGAARHCITACAPRSTRSGDGGAHATAARLPLTTGPGPRRRRTRARRTAARSGARPSPTRSG